MLRLQRRAYVARKKLKVLQDEGKMPISDQMGIATGRTLLYFEPYLYLTSSLPLSHFILILPYPYLTFTLPCFGPCLTFILSLPYLYSLLTLSCFTSTLPYLILLLTSIYLYLTFIFI